MALEEGLLALVVKRLGVGGARVAETQLEELDARALAAHHDLGFTPVDLGLLGGVVDLGDERRGRALRARASSRT